MSWKDSFYFTSSQRRALFLLSVISVLLFVCNLLLPTFLIHRNEKEVVDSVFLAKICSFKNTLNEQTYHGKTRNNSSSKQMNPFRFNPNTLDSTGFLRLGLSHFTVRNILKYRSKGGRFKYVNDFLKVYGISGEEFEVLSPFIEIPTIKKMKEEVAVVIKKESPVILNLNIADTAQLKTLKGIGSSFAKRIVAYRKKLGGFYSKHQLKEVWGLSTETYLQISPYLIVSSEFIIKIQVNQSSLEKLRSHPYINFYQARAIYEYRKDEGKIKSLEEAKLIEDENLTEEFWEKVVAYLEF